RPIICLIRRTPRTCTNRRCRAIRTRMPRSRWRRHRRPTACGSSAGCSTASRRTSMPAASRSRDVSIAGANLNTSRPPAFFSSPARWMSAWAPTEKGNRDGGFGLRMFYGITPETENTTWFFWSTANGHRQNDPQATGRLFRSIEEAFKEDDHVLEAQQETLRRLGDRRLINIASDVARVHARNAL